MLIRWSSAGRQANPTTGAILADTGPILNDGGYFVHVVARSSVAADIQIQHRDASNTANVEPPVEIIVPAGSTVYLTLAARINPNERIRAVLLSGIVGDVTVTIVVDYRLPWMH